MILSGSRKASRFSQRSIVSHGAKGRSSRAQWHNPKARNSSREMTSTSKPQERGWEGWTPMPGSV